MSKQLLRRDDVLDILDALTPEDAEPTDTIARAYQQVAALAAPPVEGEKPLITPSGPIMRKEGLSIDTADLGQGDDLVDMNDAVERAYKAGEISGELARVPAAATSSLSVRVAELEQALQSESGVSIVLELRTVADTLRKSAQIKSANTLDFWADRLESAIGTPGKGRK